MTVKDMVAALTVKGMVAALTVKDMVASLTVKDMVASLTVKDMVASLTVKGRKNVKKLNLGGNNVAQKKKKWRNIVKISTFRR